MKKSEIEKRWNEMKEASPERIAEIKRRNAELRASSRKDTKISARVNSDDWILFNALALSEGMTPSAFLNRTIHDLVSKRRNSAGAGRKQATRKKA